MRISWWQRDRCSSRSLEWWGVECGEEWVKRRFARWGDGIPAVAFMLNIWNVFTLHTLPRIKLLLSGSIPISKHRFIRQLLQIFRYPVPSRLAFVHLWFRLHTYLLSSLMLLLQIQQQEFNWSCFLNTGKTQHMQHMFVLQSAARSRELTGRLDNHEVVAAENQFVCC